MSTAAGRAFAYLADPATPDAILLARFIREQDEVAFAALVRRHGPMVLGVCRRHVGDSDLADDAFQAAFLVLARKAATVSLAAGLAGWLHGVARRAALEARTLARRRAARENPMPTLPDRPVVDTDRPDPDLLARLDRAVARLPAGLRDAVVLCELEGRSRRDAARLLGIPEGTLSSRLAAARKRLAGGLRTSAGLTAAVSVALANQTVCAALHPDSAPAPARVAAVAAGVCRMFAASKLKVVVLVAVAVAGLATLFPQAHPAEAAPKSAPEVREPRILFWTKGKAVILKSDGAVVRSWDGDQVPEVGGARLSPDGTRIAVLRPYETRTLKQMVPIAGGASLQGSFGRTLCKLTMVGVADKLTGPDVDVPGDSVYAAFWSGDGTKLYVGSHDDDTSYARLNNLRHWVVDGKTLKATKLKLPEGHHLLDVSADGKLFLTISQPPIISVCRPIWVVPADGSKPIRLTDTTEGQFDARFSPDGTRVLVCGAGNCAAGKRPDGNIGPGLVKASTADRWFDIFTIADGTRTSVVTCKDREYVWRCQWSPDGKRIIYLPRVQSFPDVHDNLTVSSPDGTGAKALLKVDHSSNACVDWR
jgi:RNA polymerase sigma factor (sigma-70 family)